MWGPDFKPDSVACPCSNFQHVLPDQCFVDGHVAAGLEQFETWLGKSSSIAKGKRCEHVFSGQGLLEV